MSKKKKSEAKVKRKAAKRARKAMQAAKYATWKEAGINSKSKRAKSNAKRGRKRGLLVKHALGFCGNVGCSRCYPTAHNVLPPSRLNLIH